MSFKIKQNLILLGKMLIFATVVLFVLSSDSYTHDFFDRNDSSWFFMCGKAWMEGMVPYVDFSDSKGPLLWLIYGVGYLLSHYDYTGVFWLSCLFYAVTFFFVYKTADLFLRDRRWSWLVVIMMTAFFFNSIYHNETKTEDFAQPFMMGAIYLTSKLLYVRVDRRNVLQASLWLGLAFGCTFLMKYNIAAIMGIFIVYALWAIWKGGYGLGGSRLTVGGWSSVWRSVLLMAAGVAVVWVPMGVCFAAEGNFGAFVHEYFYNTLHTVHNLESQGTPLDQLSSRLISDAFPMTVQLTATLAPVIVIYMRRCRTFPLVAVLVGSVVNSMNGLLTYYFNNMNGLITFGVIALALLVRNYPHAEARRINWWTGLVLLPLLMLNNGEVQGNYFYQQTETRKVFYYYAGLATQYRQPTIIFYRCMTNPDFSISSGSLPGCTYWAKQNGATRAMNDEQHQAVRRRQADLVAVYVENEAAQRFVASCGYHAYKAPYKSNNYVLYSKHKLQEPPKGWAPSPWQVLTKQRVVLNPSARRIAPSPPKRTKKRI